jgi:hypothetical protein
MSKQPKTSNRTRSAKAKQFSWKVSVKPRRAARQRLPLGCGGCK